MTTRAQALVVAGLVLLGMAWLFSTPPFQAPDEAAHYLRAVTLADGSLLGRKPPPSAAQEAALRAPGYHAAQLRWTIHDLRTVTVAAGLSPPGQACLKARPGEGGACTEASYTGDYFPLAYALPAAAIAVSHHWQSAIWWARAGALALALAFLAFAVAVTGAGRPWSLIGLLAATSPTVLYISSVINPSGLELAANLALLAGLLRIAGEPQVPSWFWVGTALSGAVTVVAWQLGPLFAAVDLVLVGTLMGASEIASHRRGFAGVAATTAVAVVVLAGWGVAAGTFHSGFSLAAPGPALRSGLDQFRQALAGAVGNFGALTVRLPLGLVLAWGALAAGLLGAGVWLGRGRERIALAAATAAAVAVPVLFYAFSYRLSGFGLQGRYILPALAPVPMLAGAILDRRVVPERRGASRRPSTVALLGVGALAALQLAAWWVDAHHWSAGTGALLSGARWSPPPGWPPLLAAAGLGAVALAAGGVSSGLTASRHARERVLSR